MDNKKLFAFLLIFLVIVQLKFIYSPAKNRLNSLNGLIETRESELADIQRLCVEYSEWENMQKQDAGKIAKADFSLFSYTGGLLAKQKLEMKVAGIQPLPLSEKEGFLVERLKLSLKNVQLKQLYDFLYTIENSKNSIYIPDFRMRRDKENPFLLNTEIELIAVKAANQETGTEQ